MTPERTNPNRKRTMLIVAAAAVVLTAGVGWMVWAGQPDVRDDLASADASRLHAALGKLDSEALRGKEGVELSKLTMESMRKLPVDQMMQLWRPEGASDEERERMGENMRLVFMNYMGSLADEYFAAESPESKDAILDRQIDQWVEFQNKMKEYRESQPEDEKLPESRPARWGGGQTTADRKQRNFDADPDRQAKMWHMMTQMRKRAETRGVEMGWGPGGRFGGGGGRPGGGRPGGDERPGGRS